MAGHRVNRTGRIVDYYSGSVVSSECKSVSDRISVAPIYHTITKSPGVIVSRRPTGHRSVQDHRTALVDGRKRKVGEYRCGHDIYGMTGGGNRTLRICNFYADRVDTRRRIGVGCLNPCASKSISKIPCVGVGWSSEEALSCKDDRATLSRSVF